MGISMTCRDVVLMEGGVRVMKNVQVNWLLIAMAREGKEDERGW